MSFFQRVGNAMARFMYGRNGGDRLGLVTIWTAIVIDVVCLFIKGYQVPYLILSTLSTAMVLWALWRMFSRNLAKRRAENAWFMSKVLKKILWILLWGGLLAFPTLEASAQFDASAILRNQNNHNPLLFGLIPEYFRITEIL